MRATVSLLALLIATPALADDVFAQAPVAAAEIYPNGATLTLRADVDLPAGEHRVMIVYPGAEQLERLPRVAVSEGVTVGALGFRRDVTADPRSFYTPEQVAAAEAVDLAEDAILAKEDELSIATSVITALEARTAYLTSVVPPENAEPAAVLEMAEFVSAQVAETAKALSEAKASLRPLQEDLADLRDQKAAAEAALDRLAPPGLENDVLIVSLTVAEAGPVALAFTEQVWDAGWQVDYDMDLDRDTGEITVDRKLMVYQETDRPWTDVALTLSTARPNEAIAPTEVWPDLASTYEPRFDRLVERDAAGAMLSAEPAPMVMAEDAQVTAEMKVDGLAVTYVYPEAVSVMPGEVAELALDTLTLEAEPVVQASPRYDETAFLIAEFTNTTGEALLPGMASLSRDGAYVGQMQIEMIPANAADQTLPFGPIDGIRLETIFPRNAEGGSGIINKSSTRTQKISFTVENLTDETQDVRTLFPLTFSEQEELEVEVTALPEPDETDVDEKRGVSAWNLMIEPGQTARVEIEVDLDWPEGKELNWRP